MVEILGIATELAERRKRIAALQSPSVRARVVPVGYVAMSDDVKRLTAENDRLQVENARLLDEVDRLRQTVEALQHNGRWSLESMGERQAIQRVCAVFEKHYGVHVGGIMAHTKERPFVRARYAVMLFLNERMGFNKITIARAVNRDHSTVKSGLRHADRLRLSDSAWLARFNDAADELMPPRQAEAA